MVTITDAEVGTVVQSNGILDSITMTKAPPGYDNDYFCLMDGTRVIYNIHISSTPVSTGGSLMNEGGVLFKDLMVQSIPTGSIFELGFIDPPTLTSLSPATAVCGDPTDIVMTCIGTGFTAKSIIKFGAYDEPTTFVSATEVTTGVKPSLFVNPDTVPVVVRNGPIQTEPQNFIFTLL